MFMANFECSALFNAPSRVQVSENVYAFQFLQGRRMKGGISSPGSCGIRSRARRFLDSHRRVSLPRHVALLTPVGGAPFHETILSCDCIALCCQPGAGADTCPLDDFAG